MDWEAIGAIGEVVGALGVIVTVGYLAVQIRENSRQMRVASSISLNHLANEAFDPIYNNDRNIRIWTQGQIAPKELSAEDALVFSLFMSRLVVVLQTALAQSQYGVHLEQQEIDRFAGALRSILGTPGGRVWLEDMGGADTLTDQARAVLASSGTRQSALAFTRGGAAEAGQTAAPDSTSG